MKFNSTKAYYYVTGVLAVALATGGCVSSSSYEKLENQYKAAEARSQELEAANKDLNDRIASLTEELKAKDAEIASLNEQAGSSDDASSEKMAVLLEEKAKLERELASLKAGQRSMDSTFNGLSDALKAELENGNIKISQVQGMVRLTIEDGVFFDSGSTDISAKGRDLLNRIANALKDNPEHSMIIEGYTDSRKIGPRLRRQYPTNWELGAARAINVVRYLSDEAGIDASRLSAQSFGANQAAGDNTTESGRAANRRIQISVVQTQPIESKESEPATEDAAKEEMMNENEVEATTEPATNEEIDSIDEVKSEEDDMNADQPAENTP